jgi:cell division protein FtsW (lipid II flippase)
VVGADITFAGAAEVVAMFALFRLQDRTWERDFVFAAVAGLSAFVVIVGLKVSGARQGSP